MRTLRFSLFILGIAGAAIPASATITYTSCSSGGGCSSSSGSYAGMPSATGATGLAFSSPITFVAAGLNGTTGIYTDSGAGTGGSGTVFTNYSSGGSADTGTQVKGTAFVQGFSFGTGTGFEIDLPANTFAFAMFGSDCSTAACSGISFNLATVGLGTQSSHGTNYGLIIPSSGPAQFFGIVSDTAITSVFFASGGSNLLNVASFEIGQEAPTPEAATFFMIGSGLLGIYMWRRLRIRFCPRARVGPQALAALPR